MSTITKVSLFLLIFAAFSPIADAQTYRIAGTGQQNCYNNNTVISAPDKGSAFYGQDAQFNITGTSYTDNGDGTITDNITNLMWQKSPDLNGDGQINYDDKLTYSEAFSGAASFKLGGYSDWRLPTIKELYSLIMFNGLDPSGYNGSSDNLKPFINTDYFEFGYGDESADERIIDAQFASSTLYTGQAMMTNQIMFGVNFADGRIKGYPYGQMPGTLSTKKFYVLYVRGNTDYGKNKFQDNGDGTISDNATGLMWSRDDSKDGFNWENALSWVQQKNEENYLGHNDWRLPTAKELQSIVDYTRSPLSTNSAAISSFFNCSEITDEGGGKDYPFFWSSTTHANMMSGGNAAYVAFGEALGWMQDPMSNYQLMDVHGAGAQRSDPKYGNPADYPYGHGPQGDVIRIYNYVRLVRTASTETSVGQNEDTSLPENFSLSQNYPNPFNPSTTINFSVPSVETFSGVSLQQVSVKVYDILGREVTTLVDKELPAGNYTVEFNASEISSGIYFYKLSAGNSAETKKMTIIK